MSNVICYTFLGELFIMQPANPAGAVGQGHRIETVHFVLRLALYKAMTGQEIGRGSLQNSKCFTA